MSAPMVLVQNARAGALGSLAGGCGLDMGRAFHMPTLEECVKPGKRSACFSTYA